MDYRFLSSTGLKVSSLVFGTMPLGDSIDKALATEMFNLCRDKGINTFDSANVYGKGKSERVLGELIKDCRDEVVIASKAYFPTSNDPNARGLSRYHIRNAVEASLKRLNTDRIDLYFLHRFDDATSMEDTFRCLDDLVRDGKILYPALSNFAAWQASKALGLCERYGWAKPVAVQPMYNLVKRQAEVEILPMAKSENLGVFPYSPLGGGLLSGKYGSEKRPDQGRLVDNKMYGIRYGSQSYYNTAEAFTALAMELGKHPAALAVAWVAAHPAVTAPIIGARNMEHLKIALQSLDIEVDESLYRRIADLSPTPPPATDRNEEASAHNYGSR